MLRILLKSFNYLYLTVQCLNTGPLALVILFIWVQMFKTTNSRNQFLIYFLKGKFHGCSKFGSGEEILSKTFAQVYLHPQQNQKVFAIWHAYMLLVNIIEKNWLQVHIVSDVKDTYYFWKKTNCDLLTEISFDKSYKYCIVWSRMLKAPLLTLLKAS